MIRHILLVSPVAFLGLSFGCIDLSSPLVESSGSLLPTGTSFIITGTATLTEDREPCLVWIGTNGVTYYLFQSTGLANDAFDEVTTPGVTSRLELASRTDLEVTCRVDTVVEVQSVYEIVE